MKQFISFYFQDARRTIRIIHLYNLKKLTGAVSNIYDRGSREMRPAQPSGRAEGFAVFATDHTRSSGINHPCTALIQCRRHSAAENKHVVVVVVVGLQGLHAGMNGGLQTREPRLRRCGEG